MRVIFLTVLFFYATVGVFAEDKKDAEISSLKQQLKSWKCAHLKMMMDFNWAFGEKDFKESGLLTVVSEDSSIVGYGDRLEDLLVRKSLIKEQVDAYCKAFGVDKEELLTDFKIWKKAKHDWKACGCTEKDVTGFW